MEIPFNRPLILGTEQAQISKVFEFGKFSGNGDFGSRCQRELEKTFGFRKCLLTTSCTSALEFAALILDIGEGDEVIVPSFAFVTTASAFTNRGANLVFADSRADHPSIDESKLEELITPKTKAIVALHYGGVACEMDTLKAIAEKYAIHLIEDNAQGIASYYNEHALGSIGTLGALSFHETKNIHCGEGGAIIVNEDSLIDRADIVWDMGTNRRAFKDGKVNSYGWVDVGSSFYPSELNSAFLLAQINNLEHITAQRMRLWKNYFKAFEELDQKGFLERPKVPDYAKHNGHTFYLLTKSREERDGLIAFLAEREIQATFHFQSLHRSAYYRNQNDAQTLMHSDRFSDQLLRLPLHAGVEGNQHLVVECVLDFYKNR